MKKAMPYFLIISGVILSIAGCNLITGKNGTSTSAPQATVSFQTQSGKLSTQYSAVTFTDSTTSDSLTIDTAKVLINKLVFYGDEHEMAEDSTKKGMSEDSSENEWSEHHHNEDSVEVKFHDKDNVFRSGPYVLDVKLDTTVSTVGVTNLPHGTYDKIFFLIHRAEPGEKLSDSEFIDTTGTDSANGQHYYSIIIKGSYNGKPFVFKSSKTFFVKTSIKPPLAVTDSIASYNATVQIKLSDWFRDRDGHLIDPTNPANDYKIEWAIRRSFHAFEDNNRDGHDDHYEHGFGYHH